MSSANPVPPSPSPPPLSLQQLGFTRPPTPPPPPSSPSFPARAPFLQPPYIQYCPSLPFAQPYYAQFPWAQMPGFLAPPSPRSYQAFGYTGSPMGGGQDAQSRSTQLAVEPDPESMKLFEMVDLDGSGHIDASELQKALSGDQPFSIRTVHLMIHLYSTSGNDKICPVEFAALWKALKEWKVIFEKFDQDSSGTMDSNEMRKALLSIGYAISPAILQCLLQKYDRTGQAKALDFDSFVECGLIVKGLTERFKERDVHLVGSATLTYDDFMLMVLPFIVA